MRSTPNDLPASDEELVGTKVPAQISASSGRAAFSANQIPVPDDSGAGHEPPARQTPVVEAQVATDQAISAASAATPSGADALSSVGTATTARDDFDEMAAADQAATVASVGTDRTVVVALATSASEEPASSARTPIAGGRGVEARAAAGGTPDQTRPAAMASSASSNGVSSAAAISVAGRGRVQHGAVAQLVTTATDPAGTDDTAPAANTVSASSGKRSSSADAPAPGSHVVRHEAGKHSASASGDLAETGATGSAMDAGLAPSTATTSILPVVEVAPQLPSQGSSSSARPAPHSIGASPASEAGVSTNVTHFNPPSASALPEQAAMPALAQAETADRLPSSIHADLPPLAAAAVAPADGPPTAAAAIASKDTSSAPRDANAVMVGNVPIASNLDTPPVSSSRSAGTAHSGIAYKGNGPVFLRSDVKSVGGKEADAATPSNGPTIQDVVSDTSTQLPVDPLVNKASSDATDTQTDHPPLHNRGENTPVPASAASASAVLVGLQDPASAAAPSAQSVPSIQGTAPENTRTGISTGQTDGPNPTAFQTAPSAVTSAGDVEARDLTPAETVKGLMAQASATEGGAKLTVSLHPKELGAVTVELERSADGSAKITVSASAPATLRGLMVNKDQLHAALDAASVPLAGRHLTFELSGPSVSSSPQHTHIPIADYQSSAASQERSDGQPGPDVTSRNSGQQSDGSGRDQRRRLQQDQTGASRPDDSTVPAGLSGSGNSFARRTAAAGINITA